MPNILKKNKNLSGIFLMVIHALALSALYLFINELTKTLHSFQIAFLYKFTIFVFILPWCLSSPNDTKKSVFKTKKLSLHVAHGIFSMLGTLCFIMAMNKIDPMNVAAISYFDHILVVFIGIVFFKEKLLHSKITALILNLAGVIFIVKPCFDDFNFAYIYLFMAIAFWAGNCIIIKMLTKTERSKVQLFYSMGFASLFSLPMALYEWRDLEATHIYYVLALASCYLIHKTTFFKALKFSEISIVMPFDYCRLIFTGLLGYIFLNKIPDTYSVFGYALIVFGGLYLIFYQAKKHK
jgi:drug/metabolite transporter (DMT)-like permease